MQIARHAKLNGLPIGAGVRAPTAAPPERYVNARRAAKLLKANPSLSRDEVARRCGYANRRSMMQSVRALAKLEGGDE